MPILGQVANLNRFALTLEIPFCRLGASALAIGAPAAIAIMASRTGAVSDSSKATIQNHF